MQRLGGNAPGRARCGVLGLLATSSIWLGLLPGGAARAGDLYTPPPALSLKDTPEPLPAALWQGFYFGGKVGAAFSSGTLTDNYTYFGDPTAHIGSSGTGVIGGGQAGYNIQRDHIVYGVEFDIGALDLAMNKTAVLQRDPGNDAFWLNAKYSTSGNVYGDLTARLGYAEGTFLFYAKGGAAALNADISAEYLGGNCSYIPNAACGPKRPSTFNFEHGDTLWGWTVGGGVEYAVTPALSVKIEYQHFDFGSATFGHDGTYLINPATGWHSTLTGKAEAGITADAVMVGLNYHIGGGPGIY